MSMAAAGRRCERVTQAVLGKVLGRRIFPDYEFNSAQQHFCAVGNSVYVSHDFSDLTSENSP